jgi:phage terminase large subunit
MRRGIGLGPERDFSSHAADAFGLMCGAYEPPRPLLSQSITVPSFGVV